MTTELAAKYSNFKIINLFSLKLAKFKKGYFPLRKTTRMANSECFQVASMQTFEDK
jgi:hypothetical protein